MFNKQAVSSLIIYCNRIGNSGWAWVYIDPITTPAEKEATAFLRIEDTKMKGQLYPFSGQQFRFE